MKIKPTSNSDKSRAGSDESRAGIQRPTPNIQCQGERMHSMLDVGCWMLDVPPRQSQRGIALVITLIMLSIITFMTVVFLVISTRERASVSTTTDSTTARFAAEAALERAKAQMLARILATTNDQAYDLMVSTNYDTDVSLAGLPFLMYDPRTPVFMSNTVTRVMENRYYLDLNRNGTNDPNGWLPVVDGSGKQMTNSNGSLMTNFFVGDPEWIGVAEHPDQPLSSTNKLVARYAFAVLPAGKTLDINYIHNQSFVTKSARTFVNPSPATGADTYLRNQGVGSWEINLAAFLADLNTNRWNNPLSGGIYQYTQATPNNRGAAFDDARALLAYRYANSFSTLALFRALYGNAAANIIVNDNINEYSDGPLQTTTAGIDETLPGNSDNAGKPWLGANNTNHFFITQDLFDPTKTATNVPSVNNFTTRLLGASTNSSSYDRYTFYRLLAQLGTDSVAESGKINVNYTNVDVAGNIVSSLSTNFGQWAPVQFFTTAANALLSSTFAGITNAGVIYPTNFGINYIQIYPTNQYTPAVHRLLQLAANIYDATTDRRFLGTTNSYPTVFRPRFVKINNVIYITGYAEVTNVSFLTLGKQRFLDDTNSLNLIQPDDQVYGIPLVLGAKKGLPNFNEVAMQNTFQITRKLLITRLTTNTPPSQFRYFMQYNLGVSNVVGVEAWNSYSNNYSRPVDIYVTNYMSMALTNDYGLNRTTLPGVLTLGASRSFPNPNSAVWPGYDAKSSVSPSLQVVLMTNVALLPQSIYRYGPPAPFLTTNMSAGFETNNPLAVNYFPQPHWSLAITNRLLFMIVDRDTKRVLDYVQLSGLNSMRNLSAEIQDPNNALGFAGLWSTNTLQANTPPMPQGVYDQIDVSKGNQGGGGADWTAYGANIGNGSKLQEIDKFRVFFYLSPVTFTSPTDLDIQAVKSRLSAQVPFAPTQRFYQHLTWQANDPLVHYLTGDLGNVNPATPGQKDNLKSVAQPIPNIGLINDRYQPWGGKPDQDPDANAFNMTLKDPLMISSDNWDFPTNKFPNVGWLGRVHRGTPWQTVYLKASPVIGGLANWQNWSGNPNANNAILTQPTNDWRLASLLASMFNTNDFRFLFSVNNPNPNAWQALLDGLTILTNDLPDGLLVISSNSPQALLIANAIQSARIGQPGQFFRDVGDILAVPQLTEQSPFLNWNDSVQVMNGISDEVYEMIPSQLLSLLRADSIGSIAPVNGQRVVQFTGYDGHAYAIEVSSDLINWVSISTNCPVNGMFGFTNSAAPNANQQFYRSVLLQ